jgi:hypothetical protein
MVESKTRIIQDNPNFWIDKPLQKGHPKYKEKTKWYHIHSYKTPYNPIHKSVDGMISEKMNAILYKCKCGKCEINGWRFLFIKFLNRKFNTKRYTKPCA